MGLGRYHGVIGQLELYFAHLRNPGHGHGYQRDTIAGKMVKGEIGNANPGPSVPRGIEFSDTEYLRTINRIDCAMVALKTQDNINDTRLWDYVMLRYGKGQSICGLAEFFDISKSTCLRRQRDALKFLECRI